MKILLVSTSFFPKIDGSTRCIYDHARKLVERGNAVYLVTRAVSLKSAGSFGTRRYEELDGIKIFRTGVILRTSTKFNLNKLRLALDQARIIFKLQRENRFSVVHVHGYSAFYTALPWRYIFRVPILITTHGTELLWPKSVRWKSPLEVKLSFLFEKFALKLCDFIIAQSEGVRRYMLKFYGKHISSKIRIIPTGVDHEKFRVSPKQINQPQILFAGALSEVKGLSCLIRAFAGVRRKFPDSLLVLAGAGPAMNRYKEMVKELNLDGSVRFLGAVREDSKMIELYANSDVVVLPSNVGGPISCTILEGLSSGRPVISTNVPGGIPDVINGSVGALIEPEDVESLTSELLKLISNREYRERIGANARRSVEQNYTLELMTDELVALYKEIGRF